MKNNLFIYYLIYFIFMFHFVGASDFQEYDPSKRHPDVQKLIDERFDFLSSRWCSQWKQNGEEKYYLFNIDEHLLKKKIIFADPSKKQWNEMDKGGGKFQAGHKSSYFFNEDPDLVQRDLKVKIINTGAEQYQGSKIEDTPKCTIYNLGQFKLENFTESLNKSKVLADGESLDFITCSWCYPHFTDFLRSLVEAYNALGYGGLMFFNGGPISIASPDEEPRLKRPSISEGNCFIMKALLDLKIPYLMKKRNADRSYNEFMIQKKTENIQRFPYSFGLIHDEGEDTENSSRYSIHYISNSTKNNIDEITRTYDAFMMHWDSNNPKAVHLLGDKSLFDYLNQFDICGSYPIQYFGPVFSDEDTEGSEAEDRPTNAGATASELAALDAVWNQN